jgi:hypothetical protein
VLDLILILSIEEISVPLESTVAKPGTGPPSTKAAQASQSGFVQADVEMSFTQQMGELFSFQDGIIPLHGHGQIV